MPDEEELSGAQKARRKHREERRLLTERHAQERQELEAEIGPPPVLALADDTLRQAAIIQKVRELARFWINASIVGDDDPNKTHTPRWYGEHVLSELGAEVSMIDEIMATPEGRARMKMAEENANLRKMIDEGNNIIKMSVCAPNTLGPWWRQAVMKWDTLYRELTWRENL